MEITFHSGETFIAVSERQRMVTITSGLDAGDPVVAAYTFEGQQVDVGPHHHENFEIAHMYYLPGSVVIVRASEAICTGADIDRGAILGVMRGDPFPMRPLFVAEDFTLAICVDPAQMLEQLLAPPDSSAVGFGASGEGVVVPSADGPDRDGFTWVGFARTCWGRIRRLACG